LFVVWANNLRIAHRDVGMCSPFWLIMNEFMRQWAQPQMRVHKFACQESEFHFITECTGKNYTRRVLSKKK